MSLESELLDVISKYGLATASSKIGTAAGTSAMPMKPGGAVASYIREIITGDVGFDERILKQVTTVLTKGVGV